MTAQFKKALVTGGAGFIGSHLVDALLAGDCQVAVLDNLSSGKLSNLNHVQDKIRFYKNDIKEPGALEDAAKGCDVIFHLAAVVSVQQTIDHPLESTMVNDIGTLNVLEAARKANVKRVVLASSCAVYGDDPRLPKEESMIPKPCSPYAVHKLSAEHYARIYDELHGLETVSLRFFNVFGPRQDPSSPYSGVISIFMNKAVSNQIPVIYGDGNQSRDFVYVKDVVKANLLAAERDNIGGKIFNVGTGSFVRINRLWELISSLNGQPSEPRHGPARPGDILHSVANIESAKALLKFRTEVTLEAGLERTLNWYRNQGG
ncbi:MAG: SDR family oxidoreductase [Desulfobacterales bacterium]|jgi:UDP-glucose 4-epimerase